MKHTKQFFDLTAEARQQEEADAIHELTQTLKATNALMLGLLVRGQA